MPEPADRLRASDADPVPLLPFGDDLPLEELSPSLRSVLDVLELDEPDLLHPEVDRLLPSREAEDDRRLRRADPVAPALELLLR